MGSVFPLDLILFYFLIFSKNPSDASETRHRIYLPTAAQSVDPVVEYVDAVASPESESGEQQQPTTTTTTTC